MNLIIRFSYIMVLNTYKQINHSYMCFYWTHTSPGTHSIVIAAKMLAVSHHQGSQPLKPPGGKTGTQIT